MSIGDLFSYALAVVSIATLAGLGFMRGTVTNLREQLKDTRDTNAELRAERAEDAVKIEQLKTDLDALSRVVTGEVHWAQLGHQLDEHHGEARTHWAEADQRSAAMLAALLEVADILKDGSP